jgi:lysozyme
MDHKRLEDTLIRHEEIRYKPYRCSEGKLTIGVGRNIEEVGITEDESIYLMRNDIKECEEHLSKFSWYYALSDVRQEILVNMCFNMGYTRFLGFRKMIWALENEDHVSAAKEMKNSKWFRQVGIRAEQLVDAMLSDSFNTKLGV